MRVCKNCGSTDFMVKGTQFVCKYCRSPFVPDFVNPNGTQGVGISEDIQRLLQKCYEDPRNAKKYANRILDIDPTNIDAKRFLR